MTQMHNILWLMKPPIIVCDRTGLTEQQESYFDENCFWFSFICLSMG